MLTLNSSQRNHELVVKILSPRVKYNVTGFDINHDRSRIYPFNIPNSTNITCITDNAYSIAPKLLRIIPSHKEFVKHIKVIKVFQDFLSSDLYQECIV